MRPAYMLKHGSAVLGTLQPYDSDFPWINCKFEPTASYASFKPLFDAERQDLEKDADMNQWEKLYQKIVDLGVYLEAADNSEKIEEFLLHIEGDKAWFRY